MTSIKNFLPKKENEKPVQVEFPESLLKQLKEKLKSNDLTLKDFFVAAARAYLSEKT